MERDRITLDEFVNALRFELGEHGNKEIAGIGVNSGRCGISYSIDVKEGDCMSHSIHIPMYKEDYYKKYEIFDKCQK